MRCRGAVAAAACLLVAAACASEGAARERPSIVVTTNVLGDIVRNVAGDQADVEVLLPPGADPHSFALSAAAAERLAGADLVVANGLGLEQAMGHHVRAARADGVPVLEVAPLLEPRAFDAGADEGRLDPHVWTDPVRMRTAVGIIEATVAELAGVDRATLEDRVDRYQRALTDAEASMRRRFASIPADRRVLVTNHHVFGYFAERFGFRVVGTVLPSGATLAAPSAADLEELVSVLRATDVPAIFADSSNPTLLAETVAREAGLDVAVVSIYTESLGPPGSGADTYLRMLDTNTDRIVAALAPP